MKYTLMGGYLSLQKLSVHFRNGSEVGEGARIRADNALKLGNVAFADNADEHALPLPRIHSLRGNARNAVVELGHNLFRDDVGLVGDNLEFVRRFKALHDPVARLARNKQADERQEHGVELFGEARALIVDEEGREHHAGVERGREHTHAQIAVFFVDEGGENRRPARGAAAAKHDGERNAENDPARDRCKQAVVRYVLDFFDTGDNSRIEQNENARTQQHGGGSDDRFPLSEAEKRHKEERHVEHEQKPPRVPPRAVFEQDGDTVRAARRKVVGRDEHINAERAHDARNEHGQHVRSHTRADFIPKFSCRLFHDLPLSRRLGNAPTYFECPVSPFLIFLPKCGAPLLQTAAPNFCGAQTR